MIVLVKVVECGVEVGSAVWCGVVYRFEVWCGVVCCAVELH